MNKETFIRAFAIGVLFLIPFNIKKFLVSFSGAFPYLPLEFTSLFLYVSEFCVLFFILFVLLIKAKDFFSTMRKFWLLYLFSILSFLSIFVADVRMLSFISAIHIFVAIVFASAIATLVQTKTLSIRDVMKLFAISTLIEAEIAILQFIHQGSIGLRFLGEETIHFFIPNVAKINIFELSFIRSYGTFSHPNVLGGFLVIGVAAWMYLFASPSKRHGVFHRSLSLIGLFVVCVGLIVSFSRSAWIAAMFVFFSYVFLLFRKKGYAHAARELFLSGAILGTILLGMFGWAIISRGTIKNDSAMNERDVYMRIATDMITDYPFGVGVGNGIIRAEKEERYTLYGLYDASTHQPIHNVYLLIAEELGVLGLLVFLFFVGYLLCAKKQYTHLPDNLFVVVLFLSFLFIGFFDHYFFTLTAGRLMFFSLLGVLGGILKEKQCPCS